MAIDGAAWLGFGGVIAGAALGYASSALQEQARRRHEAHRAEEQADREDRVRFEERRFGAYVAVVELANRLYAAAKYPGMVPAELEGGPPGTGGTGGTGGVGGPRRSPVADPDAYVEQLEVAYAQFRGALSPAFIMTSSVRTRDAIAALAGAVRDLFRGATDARHPAGSLAPLYYGHRQALRVAEAAMRAEFGIVAEPSPEPSPGPSPEPSPGSSRAGPSAVGAPTPAEPASPTDLA